MAVAAPPLAGVGEKSKKGNNGGIETQKIRKKSTPQKYKVGFKINNHVDVYYFLMSWCLGVKFSIFLFSVSLRF
jgi:hypothetical protein